MFQYFHICEEAEWAVEVLKETGKSVMASLCITSECDYNGVPTEECAVRLVKAGKNFLSIIHHHFHDHTIIIPNNYHHYHPQ